MATLSLSAPAKLNLGLQVLGRRANGYHTLVTVLQTLELADLVHIDEHDVIDGRASLDGLPRERDLTILAAERLHARLNPGRGACLRVEKHIPAAAGLGGGSSDAAAALLGLDALWQTTTDLAVLTEVAASLGADVPFFLHGGTALATGRGDAIRPLASAPDRWVALVRPDATIATADAYAALDAREWSSAAETHALAREINQGRLPAHLCRNDLTAAAIRLVPEVRDVLNDLRAAGAVLAMLAGSGPTCFGLFEREAEARAAEGRLAAPGVWTATTRFWCPPRVPGGGPRSVDPVIPRL